MAQARRYSQGTVQKKIEERLINPHVPAAVLRELKHHYKIKLQASGYRLIYRVDDQSVTVTVVAAGKRERNAVYEAARAREKRRTALGLPESMDPISPKS